MILRLSYFSLLRTVFFTSFWASNNCVLFYDFIWKSFVSLGLCRAMVIIGILYASRRKACMRCSFLCAMGITMLLDNDTLIDNNWQFTLWKIEDRAARRGRRGWGRSYVNVPHFSLGATKVQIQIKQDGVATDQCNVYLSTSVPIHFIIVSADLSKSQFVEVRFLEPRKNKFIILIPLRSSTERLPKQWKRFFVLFFFVFGLRLFWWLHENDAKIVPLLVVINLQMKRIRDIESGKVGRSCSTGKKMNLIKKRHYLQTTKANGLSS